MILARHGRKHSIMPSNVNYRANIWALKNVGCTHIIVSTATGSLQEDIKPGDIVILDNFIDRTTKRNQTFYDGRELSPFGVYMHCQSKSILFIHTFYIFYRFAIYPWTRHSVRDHVTLSFKRHAIWVSIHWFISRIVMWEFFYIIS